MLHNGSPAGTEITPVLYRIAAWSVFFSIMRTSHLPFMILRSLLGDPPSNEGWTRILLQNVPSPHNYDLGNLFHCSSHLLLPLLKTWSLWSGKSADCLIICDLGCHRRQSIYFVSSDERQNGGCANVMHDWIYCLGPNGRNTTMSIRSYWAARLRTFAFIVLTVILIKLTLLNKPAFFRSARHCFSAIGEHLRN